jgi:hypothetical protein
MRAKRPTSCQACGHRGGRLKEERSVDVDRILAATGAPVRVEALWACAGPLFAEDGPTACLRRMTR